MPSFSAPAFVLPAGGKHVDVATVGTVNDLPGVVFVAGSSMVVRMLNATDTTITGVSGGIDGAVLIVVRAGVGNVLFSHQSASSIAGNRLFNLMTSAVTPISTGGSVTYVYDGVSAQWRLIAHFQGLAITPATPTFGGNGAMTYTGVTAASTPKYQINGKVLLWTYDYTGTVGGTANTNITITLPLDATLAVTSWALVSNLTDARTSMVQCTAGGTAISIFTDQSAVAPTNWTLGTHRMMGTLMFELT